MFYFIIDFRVKLTYNAIRIYLEVTIMPSPKNTGGPIVKTGPTAGQTRSRNQDGTWRKKRSDTGTSKKK